MTDLLFCVYLLCVVAQDITYVFWLTTIVIIVSASEFIFSSFINFTVVGESGLELKKIDQVRIACSYKRGGFVQAGCAVLMLMVSDVLVFLNSHIACDAQLLQPFLKRVQENPICVHEICFSTSMHRRTCMTVLTAIQVRICEPNGKSGTLTLPATTSTPMITSGLFYVDKAYFTKSDKCDGSDGCCGVLKTPKFYFMFGNVTSIPCSHAGHAFSRRHRYSFPYGRGYVFARNILLTAEVWMDEYKKYYYSAVPLAKNISFDKEILYPDLQMPLSHLVRRLR
uniref:Glycosyltransferase 2-like domain-containing protein n=1 Tax=Glossina austeni TaxID=7395 RepID=A0A1A9VTT3_GLOAU